MNARSLLVELFVEELPPKALRSLGESFATSIGDGLRAQGLLSDHSVVTGYASPRRLAVHIEEVLTKGADKTVRQKLMPAAVGLSATGEPTAALLKRLSALGLDAGTARDVQRVNEGKGESLYLTMTVNGAELPQSLQQALDEMLAKLPIPKVMSYQLADGWTTVKFVRPAHGLVALHGGEVVPVNLLGLTAGRTTYGHRFEAAQPVIELQSADEYAARLAKDGAVIAGFGERRAEIERQLRSAGERAGLQPVQDEALLDEVTALVERPNVLACQFEREFLAVPAECLILTMKANQKYFPLLNAKGSLSNRFLVVSNVHPDDPERVIQGNERVVRPRLADAKFFYDQDRKRPLDSHLDGLAHVVYHNKLGSQLDRVRRIEALVGHLTDSAVAAEAARLCKCDLLTSMVGEFPELQGIMGRYYALAEGKLPEVAEAIREHYLPRGSGDELPTTQSGMALAIADKIDAIAGVFAIDQKPTGAKDPFGVRRATIGLLRIVLERGFTTDLVALIERAVELQPVKCGAQVAHEIYDYIMERLRGHYLEGAAGIAVTTEMFDAVLANRPVAPLDFDKRLRALQEFLRLEDAQSLAAANKRSNNILRKTGRDTFGTVQATLLRDPAEVVLGEQIAAIGKVVAPLVAQRDYAQVLTKLASLRPAVDAFFDGVMVMAEDEALRNNRLALLAQLRSLFAQVADLSLLPG